MGIPQSHNFWIKEFTQEFLLWLSGLRTQHSVHEDLGSIPGLFQWVKDLRLPQAAEYIADVAWIQYCCGCGVGWLLQFWFSLRTSMCHRCGPKKKEKNLSTWDLLYLPCAWSFVECEKIKTHCVQVLTYQGQRGLWGRVFEPHLVLTDGFCFHFYFYLYTFICTVGGGGAGTTLFPFHFLLHSSQTWFQCYPLGTFLWIS